MISVLKKILSSKYKRTIKESLGVPSLHWSLKNIKHLGYKPNFVLDIGAYVGNWTSDFLEVFPNTKILMIEPQKRLESYLNQICQKNTGVSYHIALLSSEDGKILYFKENETASHVVSNSVHGDNKIYSESLDKIIERKRLEYPDFLKLDVQGFELEVLKGGTKALAFAELCLIEVTILDLDNTPLLVDAIKYMDSRGFQLYDICQFMRRPYDKALYQLDALFVKKNSSLIKEKRWI